MSGGEPGTSASPRAGPTIADLLDRFPVLDPPVTTAGAAVTIVLRSGASDTEILLIERSKSPTDPASGEVALPGGRVADRDGNLRMTAVRELEEEVGLSESDLAGPLRFVRTELAARFGLKVGVFAGEISPHAQPPAVHNPREVAHVFWFPRARLEPAEKVRTVTGRGPREVPANVFEGHVLWGFTRRVVRDFFGLPPEGDVGGPLFAPPAADSRGEPVAENRSGQEDPDRP
jgi:8-oxo-dGTP pyrophosphatase MutT (NUDIX family)